MWQIHLNRGMQTQIPEIHSVLACPWSPGSVGPRLRPCVYILRSWAVSGPSLILHIFLSHMGGDNGTAQLLIPFLGRVSAFPTGRRSTVSWCAKRTQTLCPLGLLYPNKKKKSIHVKEHWSLLPLMLYLKRGPSGAICNPKESSASSGWPSLICPTHVNSIISKYFHPFILSFFHLSIHSFVYLFIQQAYRQK